MSIHNRLTRVLGVEHPILLAPMDGVAGGALAAAGDIVRGIVDQAERLLARRGGA